MSERRGRRAVPESERAKLYNQLQRAKRLLPPRWGIVIDVERGKESVRLISPEGDDSCELTGTLAEQVKVAIEVACNV